MAVQTAVPKQTYPEQGLPPLVDGELLDQLTFHARYQSMPPGTRAELVGGKVYIMTSPVYRPHSKAHMAVGHWLTLYEAATPEIEARDNGSIILVSDTEVQPDVAIFVRREGATLDDDARFEEIPTLVIEVSVSSEAYDLQLKKRHYQQAGVNEYIVVLAQRRSVRWFCLVNDHYSEMAPAPDGLFHSRILPGLWMDAQALLSGDYPLLLDGVRKGLEAHPDRTGIVRRR